VQLHCEVALSSTMCSCCKSVMLVTLGCCHFLEGFIAYDSTEAHKKIVRCFGGVFVRGTVLTMWGS